MKKIFQLLLLTLCCLTLITACSQNVSVEPVDENLPEVKLSVESISFNWDKESNTNDAINIRKNLTEETKVPEFTTTESFPIVYEISKSAVKIKVNFAIDSTEDCEYEIQGFADDSNSILPNTDKQVVKFTNGKSDTVTFTFESALPDKILNSQESITWKITQKAKGIVKTENLDVYTVFSAPSTENSPWKLDSKSDQAPWSDALKLLYKADGASISDLSTKEEALSAITKYFFKDHGAYYDIHEESLNHYFEIWGQRFNLSKYLWNISEDKKVSCYTQAGAVYIMSKLIGIDTDIIYVEQWGYINETNLVGYGACNNPFYQPIGCADENRPPEAVTDPDNSNRSVFGNHAFISYNNKIYDATLGPALGTHTFDEYLKAMIDISTPEEAKMADYPNKLSRKENWNHYFQKIKVD